MHAPVASESGACPKCEGRKPSECRTLVRVPREAEALHDVGMRILRGGEGDTLGAMLGVLDDEYGIPTHTGLPWRIAGRTSLKDALLYPQCLGKRAHTAGWTGTGHRYSSGAENRVVRRGGLGRRLHPG